MKRTTVISFACLVTVCVAMPACFEQETPSDELVAYQKQSPDAIHGQAHFSLNGLGNLSVAGLISNNIIPVKLYGTALLLVDQKENGGEIRGDRLPEVMQKYGFLRAENSANWNKTAGPEPKKTGSLGLIHATLERNIFGREYKLETAGFTCAVCHSGMTYDAQGRATGRAWMGTGNSSLNLDRYFNDVYRGLKLGIADQTKFMEQIHKAFPDISVEEARTIKGGLLPLVRREVKRLSKMDRAMPFPNGGPGLTNGVGAFKRNADLIADPDTFDAGEASFVSVPDISDRGFRSSLLVDGVYAPKGQTRFETIDAARAKDPRHLQQLAGVAAFFTYPAMGTPLKNIEPHIGDVNVIFDFLKVLRPPTYPGEIDANLALRGETVYSQSCAACHGTYSAGIDQPRLQSFPNRLVPQNELGTDPTRWKRFDSGLKKYVDARIFAKYIDASSEVGGYVAPILSGVWQTAPYLHNGSVPTLWHLMHPEHRPMRFQHGGHDLDLKNVGIKLEPNAKGELVFPADVKPWAGSAMFDASGPGRSNKGHEAPFRDLTEDQKNALLEYLKLL